MRTFLKSLVGVGGVALVCLLLAPAAQAQCDDPKPTAHQLGGVFTGLPESELTGRVFVLPNPGVNNNGGAQFFCKAEGDASANGGCSFLAGSSVDGRVFVNGDWSAPGVVPLGPSGCPDSSFAGASPNVAFVTSIQDEGLESHKGVYILSSVGFEFNNGWWYFDLAQLNPDLTIGDLGSSGLPKPNVTGLNPNPPVSGPLAVTLGWSAPMLHDDCTAINPLGSCTDAVPTPGDPDGARPGVLAGINIYRIQSACDTPPTSSRVLNWGAPIATLPPDALSYVDNVTFDSASCLFYALGLVAGDHVGAVSGHSTVGTGDRDNDGVPDAIDNCPDDPNPGQENDDTDFPGNVCDNCPSVDNDGQEDGDTDTVGDVCDNCESEPNTDQANNDGDSLGDVCDNCPNHTNEDQADSEGDGSGDVCDNCPAISNGDQADADGDGDGNVCDNCPTDANSDQADIDNDTFGDVCDNCAVDFNPDQSDGDVDGWGDLCDNCPTIPNPTQDPSACVQGVTNLLINFTGQSADLTWNTTTEVTIDYFNVIQIKRGQRIQANPAPIPCVACGDGRPGSYFFKIARHQNAQSWFVEIVNIDGSVQTFGPAVK